MPESVTLIVDDGGHSLGYYCKGHCSPEAFRERVTHEFGEEHIIDLQNVQHVLMRAIPVNPHEDMPYSFRLEEWDKPGRGVFKATVFYQPI